MEIFKQCTCCDIPWFSRTDFLQDCNIELVGYQVNFRHVELGYLLFNHLTCESTLAVYAGLFRDFYDGPVFAERLTASESCPGYCNQADVIEPCQEPCEGAYVREIMQIIRNWPKEEFRLAKIAQVY